MPVSSSKNDYKTTPNCKCSLVSRSKDQSRFDKNASDEEDYQGKYNIAPRERRKEQVARYYIISHRENTLTTPSPPPLTTHRPSRLQTTEHTPSPRISRWLVISWVQLRFSNDQNRRLASWPAETSSRPSGDKDRDEMAEGWASMVYVHCPRHDFR